MSSFRYTARKAGAPSLADPEIAFKAAWLFTHDREFIKTHAEVSRTVYPRGPLRYLVGMAQRHWLRYSEVVNQGIVDVVVDFEAAELNRDQTPKKEAKTVFGLLDTAYQIPDADLPALRDMAHQWLQQRMMNIALPRAQQIIEGGDIEQAYALIAAARLRSPEAKENTILSATSADHLLNLKKIRKNAIPTGFPEIDDRWGGGMRKGEIGMVAAPTGLGKSMCLCYFAAQAFWAGKSVLYYTFELTTEQIRDRISLSILQKGRDDVVKNWQDELSDAIIAKKLAHPVGYVDVRGGSMTWPELTTELEEFKRIHGKYPDLLLLDSADDIVPLRQRDATHEQLKEAFVHLRALAHEKRLRVWTSAQLNRDAIEKARVSLKHIGDAYAKAQKSHYVLGFAQSENNRNDSRGPRVQLYVLKDSLHGTPGVNLELAVEFGGGKPEGEGYPGFTVENIGGTG